MQRSASLSAAAQQLVHYFKYAAAGLIALVAMLAVWSSEALAQVPPSFGTCNARMFLAQNAPTQLFRVNTSTNPFTYPAVGPVSSFTYNAAAYDPASNYIFATFFNTSTNNYRLLRIGNNGAVQDMGAIAGGGINVDGLGAATGEIGADGFYYLKVNGATNQMWRVDLTTRAATLITLSRSIDQADFAWHNGRLYGHSFTTGELFFVNPGTGGVTIVGQSGIVDTFGAMFGASNGVFGSRNTGGFYKFDLTTGAATLISSSPSTTNNDGAKCATSSLGFPADTAITKTDNATTYSAGADVTYTIVVSNAGPFGVQGATVNDPLPAGISTASWTCTGANGGVCGVANGAGAISNQSVNLPVGGTVTYALTMSVPADFTGDLVNTASVTNPADTPDPNQSNNTATDTDTFAASEVSVQKELVGESITTNNLAEPGEVLTYRVTVTHAGGSAFSNFDFIENIPNGATMTRVSGASGFTDPVAGSATVQLTVAQVPVGGSAVVEIDLTVAAPIPLGVSQIRNMVSGGDVPSGCTQCSVTTPTPPYTPASPPTISCSTTGAYFNTAYNGAGGMKTSGFDDYWQVALTTANVTGAPPAGLTWGAATVASNPPPSYVISPFGNANWISHSATAIHPTPVSYDIFYRYQFNLASAVDPASLDLQMSFFADNSVYEVWVNGQPQGIQSNFGADPYFYAGFTAGGGASGSMNGSWQAGLNTIIVHIKSGPGAQAFMAQINTTAICRPKITLRKEVVNDNAGTATAADFTLRSQGANAGTLAEGAMGDAAVTNASVPADTYTLSEVTRPDYVAGLYSCSVDGGTAVEGNSLALANGQNAICTIINDDADSAMTVEKTGTLNDLDGDGLLDLGETITYSFLVTNTGNVTLTNVTVSDPLVTVNEGPQTLAPDGSFTFTATYTPTQADIDAGSVTNTATASGTTPDGGTTESPPDSVTVPPEQTPGMTVDKTGTLNDLDGDGLLDLGETISYSFLVTNTGSVTLTNVTIDDPLVTVNEGPQTLGPGGSFTFTANYTPTQADIDAGSVTNTATATGTTPGGGTTESPPDTVTVPPEQTPGMTVDKTGTLNDLDGDGLLDLGETISYSFLVTNTGSVTLTNVTVNDPLVTVDQGPQTLAPSATFTFTATYTPTQADIDAGAVTNTATATGTTPDGGTTTSPPDSVTVPPEQTPGMTIDKTGTLNDLDGDGLLDLGETISYSFLVRNTGSMTLTNVTVNDPLVTVDQGPQTLAPNATFTFTATYTPTQADIDAGAVTNTATATGTTPDGGTTESPPDTVTVPPEQVPGMTVDKTGTLNDLDGDGLLDLGETISYSLLVTNTGSVTLTNVTVNDPLVTVDQGPQTLAPNATFTFTATYTPTQADIDAGSVTNTATATGTTPDGGTTESPPDSVTVPPQQTPGLTIDKTGTLNDLDGDGLLDLGETISYSFLVTNTGSVTISNVTVSDPLVTVNEGPQTLAPGASFTFTATYTPTQADIDNGSVTNTATAAGTTPSGGTTESPPDTATVPPQQTPGMTIEKTGTLNDLDGDGLLDLGETISYSFLVRNTGNQTLTNVTVNDPLVTVNQGPQTLAPNATFTFTATYTPTQADIDAGSVTNTATATGTTPGGGTTESPPDTVTVPPEQTPGMTIEKTGTLNDLDGDGLLDLGETISYSFLVRNTGNVTLTNVTVNDPLVTVNQGPQTLAPNATFTFTATYTPIQADIDAGSVTNTATATGATPDGGTTNSPPDSATVPPEQTPGMTIEKTGTLNDLDGDGLLDLGETISYAFLVRNTGSVTLTNVTVNDPLVTVDQEPQTLAPNATFTFTATYTPTQADIDAGSVTNTATATGTTPSGGTTESPPDSVTVPPEQTPGLTIEKTGTLNDLDGDGLIDLGETISYSFLVTNTGSVTLTNVTVGDPLVTVNEGPQTLAPGGSFTFTASYTPTQADIDAGSVTNTATGTGTTPSGGTTTSPPDSVTVPPEQTPGLTIEKTGTLNDLDGDGLLDLGETISYSFLVTNTGSVTLTNVTVSDPLVTVNEGPQTLGPGGSFTFTATYTPTQADIDAGSVTNTATGTGTTPGGGTTTSPPDSVTVPPQQTPAMTIEKTGTLNDLDGDGLLDLGETINYSFLVTNTGNVTLTNVTVSDPLVTVNEAPQTLGPGGSFTFTATYTPTQADIDAGSVTNTATGTGTTPGGGTTESPPDTVVVPPEQTPGLTIEKTGTLNDLDGDGLLDLGETISYAFLVTNTGTVTISNVTVDDPLVTVNEGPQTLAPGASFTFTATYTPTQADIDNGSVTNTATGTGTTPGGGTTESPPDTVVVPPQQTPGLTIDKTGTLNDLDGDGQLDLGETISYSFLVTNTGSVTLTNVTVSDPLVTVNEGPQTLAPGGSFTFTASYTPTQADIDAGSVTNTATGTGTDPGGNTTESPPDSVTVPPQQTPGLTIDKTGTLNDLDGDGFLDPGETISYSFLVTNTGNLTLTNVTVDDPLLENAGVNLDQGPQTLAPGASFTFTATYTPTQADLDNGSVTNTATGTGTTPGGGTTESPPDSVTTPPPQPASLAIQKTGTFNDADSNGYASVGDTITYSFVVTNTGGQTVANVTPDDPGPTFNGQPGTGSLSDFTPAQATLAPGASQTFTATYTLSQTDIDNAAGVADGIENSATASGTAGGNNVTSDPSTSDISMPAAEPADITIVKVAGLRQIRRGEEVPFTIRVTNNSSSPATGLRVIDTLPSGFRYVDGSAKVDGVATTPVVSGRSVIFENVSVPANSHVDITLRVLALSSAGPGKHVNKANVTDSTGRQLAAQATATVEILIEPVFDCGDIIGKVFDDIDRNGYQDDGEPGLPGVRVATAKGWLVTTDKHGRFHVPCAALPDQRIGSNFIMKLDTRTLPTGYRLTTENPRVVRLTAGKMSKLNFGASIGRVVRLDLKDEAFKPGRVELKERWAKGIDKLIAMLAQEQSVLRLSYIDANAEEGLARARLNRMSELIKERWREAGGRYRLEIETRLEVGQ